MKTILTIFACLFLCGCNSGITRTNTIAVHDVSPVLSKPDKPQLEPITTEEVAEFKKLSPSLQSKLLFNDKSIKTWAEQLSVTIEDYNKYAAQHNALANQWVQSLGNPKGK